MTEPKYKVATITVKYLDVKPDDKGSRIVSDQYWYEDECISDLSKPTKKMWIFVRHIRLKVTKSGMPIITNERDVLEIKGTSHKKMVQDLERTTKDMEGEVSTYEKRNWIPNDIIELKQAIKSGALKV